MKAKRITTLLALLILFGAKAFGQVWEQSYEWHFSDEEEFDMVKPNETSSGNIVVSTNHYYKCGWGDFYAPHPALKMFASDGTELRKTFTSNQPIMEDTRTSLKTKKVNCI